MSDPMTTRPAAPPPPPPPPPPAEDPTRKGASPLIWILLLIALIAFGWWFYNRQSRPEATPDLTPPAATSDAMTPDTSRSTEKEPVARKKPAKTVAKAEQPRSRAVALIGQPKPDYPPEAYRAREEGTVMVMAQVDPTGAVSDVSVDRSSGSRTLDRAATTEVRKWTFQPAMENGKTVASSIKVPVDYKLDVQ